MIQGNVKNAKDEIAGLQNDQKALALKNTELDARKRELDGTIGKSEIALAAIQSERDAAKKVKDSLDGKIKELNTEITGRNAEIKSQKADLDDVMKISVEKRKEMFDVLKDMDELGTSINGTLKKTIEELKKKYPEKQ